MRVPGTHCRVPGGLVGLTKGCGVLGAVPAAGHDLHPHESRARVPQPLVQAPEHRSRAHARPVRGQQRGRAGPGRCRAGGARSPGRGGSRGRPPRAGCPARFSQSCSTRAWRSRNASCSLAMAARSHQRATASAVGAKPRCSPRKKSTYASRPQPLQGVPGLLVQPRRARSTRPVRPCRSRGRPAGSAARAASAAPTPARRTRRAPSPRPRAGPWRRCAGRRRRATDGRPATVRNRPRPVRCGRAASSPRLLSRDTEERTDGASTPTAASSRISSATGTGPGAKRPYAP